ncbi:MAG: hypothetical protein WC222_06150 [Parachlamydiales bacterium]|jgi:hypothetical protein
MHWRSIFAGALTLVLAIQSYISADNTTFVGPTLRGVVASPISGEAAYSVLGEIGTRNFRGNGTIAFQVGNNNYFKISTDWLTQKLRYHSVKNSHIWVHQEAYGAAYAYNFNCGILSTIDLEGYFARAHNKNYRDIVEFTPAFGVDPSFTTTIERSISGASYYGFSGGVTLEPLHCTTVSVALNWDHIDYRTKNRSLDKKQGFGGTVCIHQQVFDNVGLDLKGSWRRPFDDYQAALNWYVCGYCPSDRASIGVFGGYTHTRYGVPDVGNVGIQVGYFFGGCNSCYNPCEYDPCCEPCNTFDLVAWASRPAVYIPVVLATQDVLTSVVTDPIPVIEGESGNN